MGGIVRAGQVKLKDARARLLASVSAVLITAGFGEAQAATLNIPEQPLSLTLREIGRQTGQNILFTPDTVAGLRAHALRGQMTARQAVEDLLQGTGLIAVPDGERGLLVQRPPAQAEASPTPPPPVADSGRPRSISLADITLSEQVIVSSTRITNIGFNAPTPTTVVTSDMIAQSAQSSVFETLTDLPALQGSSGVGYNTNATSNGLIGLSALALRGLSPLRTLVLLDSQRVVGSNFNGVVDISQMPQMLIQRVDIVTGGASASWGSDAVAGVINFVTDQKFEGFKFNAQTGLSTYGDMGTVTLQAAAGTSFAGGRGHFEMAGEYSYSDGLLPRYPITLSFGALPQNLEGRPLSRLSGTVDYGVGKAPAGQPRLIYAPLIQNTGGANYGMITSGQQAFTAFDSQGKPFKFALAGTCFTDAAGALQNSVPGNGGNCLGSPSAPGDQNEKQFISGLRLPLTRGEIYATLNYGAARTQNTPAGGGNGKGITLKCDNAYLAQTGLYASTADCNAA